MIRTFLLVTAAPRGNTFDHEASLSTHVFSVFFPDRLDVLLHYDNYRTSARSQSLLERGVRSRAPPLTRS